MHAPGPPMQTMAPIFGSQGRVTEYDADVVTHS